MSARSARRARERQVERERKRERRLSKGKAAAVGAAAGTAVLFAPAVAEAAPFQVNSLADPGTGVCDATECTLREAISAANGSAGPDNVTFASGLSGAIVLDSASGQIPITEGVSIQGPGAGTLTVDADGDSRIFYIQDASTDTVSISGLTLTHGVAKYGPGSAGGAIYSTSGSGQLDVSNSRLVENAAFDAGPGSPPFYAYFYGAGGAIAAYDSAGLALTNTQVVNNYAGKYGGGIAADATDTTITGSVIDSNIVPTIKYFASAGGGGVYSADGTLSIDATTITGNVAGSGGGVYVSDTDPAAPEGLAITNSKINHNIAQKGGGGLGIDSLDSPARITGTTISDNTAVVDGGAIEFKYGSDPYDATFTLADSTLTDNTAGDDGGGLYLDGVTDQTTVRNTTFDGNFASRDGGGIGIGDTDGGEVLIDASTASDNEARNGGGISVSADDPVTIQNSTISGNTGREFGGGVGVGRLSIGAGYAGQLSVDDSTIAGNSAEADASPYASGTGGGVYVADVQGNVDISSSVIADSAAGADLSTNTETGPSVYAGEVNTGFSLIENPGTAAFSTTPAGSNITGTDPALGDLADNGGPTETQLPGDASPLIDAGIANGLTTDQRGDPRTVEQPDIPNRAGSDGTDIGAVELGVLPGPASCQDEPAAKQVGTDANELLTGTPGVDLILAGSGNDTVRGLAKGDCLSGEAGNDRVDGDAGPDQLDGGGGKDRMKGGGGTDKIGAGDGKDIVAAGGGADKVKGGAGNDKIKGAGGDDRVAGGAGRNRLNCGTGVDVAIATKKDKVSSNCETVKLVD